jgi:hypothetical protein
MQSDQFWTSQDGQVLTVQSPKKDEPLRLTLAFWPRDTGEWEFWQEHFTEFKFTERSTLARIGIEMLTAITPVLWTARTVIYLVVS